MLIRRAIACHQNLIRFSNELELQKVEPKETGKGRGSFYSKILAPKATNGVKITKDSGVH